MPSPNTLRSAVAVAACTFAVQAAGAADGLMRRVQFFPAGEFRSGDTRPEEVPSWRIDAASAALVIERFNARRKPLVVDYEHQTLNKEKNGQPAPAAGWPKSLEWVEGEGLFGLVEMTARAAAAIDGKEYLYFSPVFAYSKTDGTVLEVLMGALTNDPGIQGMQPVSLMAAATAAFLPSLQEPSVNPLLKAVLAALGLPETTTEEAATAALTALGPLQSLQSRAAVATAACTALQLDASATADTVTAACTSLRSAARTAAPDPAQYVPVAVVQELQTNLAALSASVHSRAVDDVIAPALGDGRLLPAEEAWARDTAKTPAGLASLTSLLKVRQPIAALASTQTKGQPPAAAATDTHGLTADELAVAAACGMTPEAYAKGK